MANFIPVKLSDDAENKLKAHLKNRIMALEEGLKDLHETKIVKWRKAYEAAPREQSREFPFYGASNLVVPIIAIFSDTLLARVMSAVLKTRPPWITKIFGKHEDIGDTEREGIESLMDYAASEPSELDIYRVYHDWFGDTIKFGSSLLKCPHEVRYKYEVQEMTGDDTTATPDVEFMRTTAYEGPRPEKIAFENFLVPPSARTIESADIKIHKRQMTREELMERRYFQVYSPLKVDGILNMPDRTNPGYAKSMNEQSAGIQSIGGYGYAEWDLYECWLCWPTPDGKARPPIVATYHKSTNTLMRVIYDTSTIDPFVMARLFYRDDMCYGYGFCETMWHFQEEISEIHNGRLDNRTIANARVWRVDPDSKLHSGYRIYPSAILPAEDGEIEPLAMGDISAQSIEDERFSIELAERRSGVSPPMQGYGAGVTQGKRGVYSAMGTLSLLQEGNTRTDLNISDLRYAHTKLGRIILADYAKYGLSRSLRDVFGEKEKTLEVALAAVKSGRLGLPVSSSTSSGNKEVEKQNDFILINIMRQHYVSVTGLLAQIAQPMIPQDVKTYMVQVIQASNKIMRQVLKNFEKEDVDRLIPEPKIAEQQPKSLGQASSQGGEVPGVVPFPGGGGVPPASQGQGF